MAIYGKVATTNSITKKAYESNELVLYADISKCPTFTTLNRTISVAVDYTLNSSSGSTYWTINSVKVTMSSKLPFSVYVIVKCLISSTDPDYSSGSYLAYTKLLSANTTYSSAAAIYSSTQSVVSVTAKPATAWYVQPNGVSCGVSATSYADAKNKTSSTVTYNYQFNISTSAAT